MNVKTKAASLPLLAGIVLGAASLAVPFLLANHYIYVGDRRYSADSYIFFFWGKYYTVTGTKMILSSLVTYDFGDFPVYAMIAIIIALIAGALSFFAGRGLVLNVKGRTLKLKLDINPLWLQMSSIALLLLAYLYMGNATKFLEARLLGDNYEIEKGPSLDFLAGSIGVFVVSALMTAIRSLKEERKAHPEST